MKNQLTLLCQNRRHAGAIVKLACAALLTATTALCATDPDGVTLINQATVLAAGGFPFTITQPGSYRLSSDLTVVSNATAISIQAEDVTLDLNGFRVNCLGCFGVPGILSNKAGTTILNGYVRGFGVGLNGSPGYGIHFFATRAKVEHANVFDNDAGIVAENGVNLTVTNSTVSDNGSVGVVCGHGVLTVRNSLISGNGNLNPSGKGIQLYGSALITGNTIDSNSQTGIDVTAAGLAVTVTNNTISNHSFAGVFGGGGVTGVGSNTFLSNGSDWVNLSIASMKNNACSNRTVC